MADQPAKKRVILKAVKTVKTKSSKVAVAKAAKMIKDQKKRVLVVDERVAIRMVKSAIFTNRFPWLADLKTQKLQAATADGKKKKTCRPCGGGTRVVLTSEDVAYIRRKVWNLPIKDKQLLRQLLQADEVHVYQTIDGKEQGLKF